MLITLLRPPLFFFFFFNDTATTEIYTLSLHDALPISIGIVYETDAKVERKVKIIGTFPDGSYPPVTYPVNLGDRKSTRLNSSHTVISYAVFCLKKKKIYFDNRKFP